MSATQKNEASIISRQLEVNSALEAHGKSKSLREMRASIMRLEAALFALPGHLLPEDFKTTHHFSPGVYMRELFIPKDTVLVGRIHKTEHMSILSQGDITVWTDTGMKRLQASMTIPSKPGAKRVGYAHEDTVWITVHANPEDERDLEKVESRLFSDSFEDAYLESRRSFKDALTYLGLTAKEFAEIHGQREDGSISILESNQVEFGPSTIHGRGIFSLKTIESGESIQASSIIPNHSGQPNAKLVRSDSGKTSILVLKKIQPSEELLIDYFETYKKTDFTKGANLCLL